MGYVERAAASYSMRPNTGYQSIFHDPTKLFPGPGQYENRIDKNISACMISRYKSPGTAVISKESKRFDNSALKRSMEIPGPGNYNGADSLIKVKTLIGAHEFGREKRLKDIPVERKSKSSSTS